MRVLDADSMREVDRAAIEDIGIPGLVLMENAAIGLLDALSKGYPDATAVAIFCGPGNNGGDGLALARHLASRGYDLDLHLLVSSSGMSMDAGAQLQICRNQGLRINEYGPGDSTLAAVESACRCDLVVDALFGTGLTRPLAGRYAELVTAINTLPVPCIAVDIPSGLNGSSASVLGPHIQADLTVTFAAPKVAHVLLPAAGSVGQVVVSDLGIPQALVENAPGDLNLLTREDLVGCLPWRAPASHKGDYGHAVVVAGSMGKAGAAILAARGAVRSGAGLVTVATPARLAQTLDLGSLESMTLSLTEAEDGGMHPSSVEEVLEFSKGKQVMAVGPGLGTAVSTQSAVQAIVRRAEIPVILDADGLNAFAGDADALGAVDKPRILTPHPGELARLLGVSTDKVQEDRLQSSREAALRTGSVVVLKGYQSLIAEPGGELYINSTGNPGMATGGTGDVLTGVICGLVSQGLDLTTAACLGVFVHGAAGDRCLETLGPESLAAADLLQELSAAFDSIRS